MFTSTTSTTSTASSSRSSGRGFPRRFTLRALLALTAGGAVLSWWFAQLPPGMITASQAASIGNGMTKQELTATLGEPVGRQRLEAWGETWRYRIQGPTSGKGQRWLYVAFDDAGRVWLTLHAEGERSPL